VIIWRIVKKEEVIGINLLFSDLFIQIYNYHRQS